LRGFAPAERSGGIIQVERSDTILRPVGVVFAFVADPGTWPRWQPAFGGAAPKGPFRVGDVFSQELDLGLQRLDLECEVTDYEPDERLSFAYDAAAAAQGGTFFDLDLLFEPAGPDGSATRFTALGKGEVRGPFSPFEPVVQRELDNRLGTAISNLKRILEGSTGGH